uniref:WAT1-related protein n=1 Tax=Opuntia streptacantha TaxID=393608 RepID=A0A7C9F7U9_OPUST
MGAWEEYYLPVIGMVSLEFIYATMVIMNRVALVKGLSPRIFVFYRQACATLFTSPIAYLSRKETSNAGMDFRLFLLIFVTSFVGVALFQNLYNEGLYLASSSVTSAMFNLVPAVTFLMAAVLGLEQVNVKRSSNVAKMLGTTLCVGGAIAMTLLRGQKLLNTQVLSVTHNWLVGCLLLLASVFCWSSWLILQVPITKRYPDCLSLSAWTCFFSTIQTGIMALVVEPDPKAWVLSSALEVAACLFSGIFGSGAQYFIQCWCISLGT